MTSERAADYLDQMIDAAQLARSYVAGMTAEEFMADRRTQQAVVLNLIVIGEAATRLLRDRPELAVEYTDVPWRNIRGMRNRVAHGYFELNLSLVWQTVCDSLAPLVAELQRVRSELNPPGQSG